MKTTPIAALFLAVATTLIPWPSSAQDGPVVIVTDDEASKPDGPGARKHFESTGPSEGPVIQFNKPTFGAEVGKPVAIDITFEPRMAPVDVSSLKVTYLK